MTGTTYIDWPVQALSTIQPHETGKQQAALYELYGTYEQHVPAGLAKDLPEHCGCGEYGTYEQFAAHCDSCDLIEVRCTRCDKVRDDFLEQRV